MYYNYNMTDISTPINMNALQQLLHKTNYNRTKSVYLVEGFKNGFDLGYRGPMERCNFSQNLPFSIGNKTVLWQKVMNEVQLGRYAGPFMRPPFPYFIQSPIGLVPKSGGKTRLIFHLSFRFSDMELSFNECTPKDFCSVKYKDLKYAMQACLKLKNSLSPPQGIFLAKTDLMSAFGLVPGKREHWPLLMMQAEHPVTGQIWYFFDKNLPFGTSASCRIFQEFSDALKHILEELTGKFYQTCNYLDDILFIEVTERKCNDLVSSFMTVCEQINCPISQEKTEFATQGIIFLGILLDGKGYTLGIPEEKKLKALHMIRQVIARRKITVKDIQKLTGTLNFLGRALIPSRPFMRRMYAKLVDLRDGTRKILKPHHHVTLDSEFLNDCKMWELFLVNSQKQLLCRPFIHVEGEKVAKELQFYTDAVANLTSRGFGAFYDGHWIFGIWEREFLESCKPSIQFLELYAFCLAVFAWQEKLKDVQVVLRCDNLSVCNMICNLTSRCQRCMVLIRLLTLNCLQYNRKIFAHHIRTDLNKLADSLSRQAFKVFWRYAPVGTKNYPDPLPSEIWPVKKIWNWTSIADKYAKNLF